MPREPMVSGPGTNSSLFRAGTMLEEPLLARIAQRCCAWSENWFPDSLVVAMLAVAIVAVGALGSGVSPQQIANSFGAGFWSLIPFTMQMVFIIVGGFVVADSQPAARLIDWLAGLPRTGRAAIALVASVSVLASLLHWGLSTVLSSLLTRRLGQRSDIRVDYRAAGAATCLGLGSVWALGLSSSAAQLEANSHSMPAALLAVTGVIPFRETVFLWQSVLMAAVLAAVGIFIAWQSAPSEAMVRTASDLGVSYTQKSNTLPVRARPGEWLEYSPLLTLFIASLGIAWFVQELTSLGVLTAISNLNTYNLLFLIAGLLLQWRPRHFIAAVARSVPGVGGVLVQFPLMGAVAAILTTAASATHQSLADHLSHVFTRVATHDTFAPIIGAYSAILGLFVPSGGGKWIIEAPYVMQAANALQYHLGWTVQIYNAAEAVPNLVNPFWMLPMLGILGLKARDLIGYTFVQFVVALPLVLALLWFLGMTLTYQPPVIP